MHLKDFLFAVINFVILFGALFFITRKMIARMFKERRDKIAAALDEAKAAARTETMCTLGEVCRAAAYLCRTGGVFCLVHRAERLCDVLCILRESGLEPKRLRTAFPA